ncbi:hypothetical protein O9993_18385 [Vibrio lentus]|nr:hypothetical protein [Vibrio lentus]
MYTHSDRLDMGIDIKPRTRRLMVFVPIALMKRRSYSQLLYYYF